MAVLGTLDPKTPPRTGTALQVWAVRVLWGLTLLGLGWTGYQVARLPGLYRHRDALQQDYQKHQTLPYDVLRALERETGLHDWSLSDAGTGVSASVILGGDQTPGPDGAERLGSRLAALFPGYHVIVEERRTDANPPSPETSLSEISLNVFLERQRPEPLP